MWAQGTAEGKKNKTQHSKPPRGESQMCQKSAGRGVLPIRKRFRLPLARTALPGRGIVAAPVAGNGCWDGVTSPFCSPEPPVPWHRALLGWPWGARLLPGPQSPFGDPSPSPSVLYSPKIPFFFFFSNCLNLISSSSAHHSSVFDDTNQVVGGFIMAVSNALIKASSFSRRKCSTI